MTVQSQTAGTTEGQIWYDTGNEAFKLQKILTAAWATGGNLNTARRQVAGFGESPTTAVCVCGQNPPALSLTEEYSGSAWSAVTANPEVRVKPFGTGNLTAGLVGGGESGPSSGTNSGEYDGTSWTNSATIPLTMYDSVAFGPTSAAVVTHGPQSPNTAVLLYASGGTWTTGTSSPQKLGAGSGAGTATAGIVMGESTIITNSFEYDSGTWSAGGSLNNATARASSNVMAPRDQAMIFGGNNPASTELANTELYDGTSWTNSASMNTARRGHGGAGSSGTSALAFAGYTGSDTAATEEFTGAGPGPATITVT
tara:strand:- start:5680 stop:6615 length:936 start_codon:yes stop_codon:yes gene_type:complete